MDKIIAQTIVANVWRKVYAPDERFPEALRVTGMTQAQFDALAKATRKVEVGHHGRCVLTPAGRGKR